MQQTYAAVQRDLLEANHLSPDLLAQSLSIIGANHVDYADIYCQRTAYESWHLEEGIVKSGSFQIDQGVGVLPTVSLSTWRLTLLPASIPPPKSRC
mgnify:CR=1 FL=1